MAWTEWVAYERRLPGLGAFGFGAGGNMCNVLLKLGASSSVSGIRILGPLGLGLHFCTR